MQICYLLSFVSIVILDFFINEVFLEIDDGITHLVVVTDVVGTENVHAASVLGKGTGVIDGSHCFSLVAERTKPGTATNQSVI